MGRDPANEKPLPNAPGELRVGYTLASSQDDLPGPPENLNPNPPPPAAIETNFQEASIYPSVAPVKTVVEISATAAEKEVEMPSKKCSTCWTIFFILLSVILAGALIFAVTFFGGFSWSRASSNSTTTATVTASELMMRPSSTSSPTVLPAPKPTFENTEKIFGNLDTLLSREKVVISPLALDYAMGFLGKLGSNTTQNAISKNYFNGFDMDKVFDYLADVKFLSMNFLTAFLAGDNPLSQNFMTSIMKFDDTHVYPDGVYSYSNYFNQQIKKETYDASTFVDPFSTTELDNISPKNGLIGFSAVQKTLKFKQSFPLVPNQQFKTAEGEKTVDMIAAKFYVKFLPAFELYHLSFEDARYTLFFVVPRQGAKADMAFVGKVLMTPTYQTTTLCIPEIKYQKTLNLKSHIDGFMKNETLHMKLGNNIDDHVFTNNYYQAIRFDLSPLGLNVQGKAADTASCPKKISSPFKFGIFFNDKGKYSFLYLGSF